MPLRGHTSEAATRAVPRAGLPLPALPSADPSRKAAQSIYRASTPLVETVAGPIIFDLYCRAASITLLCQSRECLGRAVQDNLPARLAERMAFERGAGPHR